MIGEALTGLGILIFLLAIAYMIYQFARMHKQVADKEEKFELFQELTICNIAKKKGIDLQAEVNKKSLYSTKTFRRELQKQMIEEMFPGKKK